MVKSYKNNGPVPLVCFGFLGSGSIFDGALGQPNHFGVQGPGSKTSRVTGPKSHSSSTPP